ncbi:MAG: pectin esterase, partial [Duncaniella sp.]|nr:pectin esterase [Duncaniella sp.]
MLKKIIITLAGLMPLSAAAAQNSPYQAIVAADGSGDYRTVSEAIAAVPTGLSSPWRILVKSGDYDEHIVIPADKPYIHPVCYRHL